LRHLRRSELARVAERLYAGPAISQKSANMPKITSGRPLRG
jgi:hypothetical protein